MARSIYKWCDTCSRAVLVAGQPMKGDVRCPHKGRTRTPMEPTVYYVNKAGKRLYPWDSRKLPKAYEKLGYERVEVQPHEIRQFERQTNREMEAEHSRKEENESMLEEYRRDQRHADLRQDMTQMDDFMKDLARLAMEDESRGYSERYDPEFRVGAHN